MPIDKVVVRLECIKAFVTVPGTFQVLEEVESLHFKTVHSNGFKVGFFSPL